MTQPGRGDRHVGRAAAEVLAERLHILQPHADLLRIDVDPAAPQGQDVHGLLHGVFRLSFLR